MPLIIVDALDGLEADARRIDCHAAAVEANGKAVAGDTAAVHNRLLACARRRLDPEGHAEVILDGAGEGQAVVDAVEVRGIVRKRGAGRTGKASRRAGCAGAEAGVAPS